VRPVDLNVTTWRKSSHSNSDGGECVEVAAHLWLKSSYSNQDGGACVEVAATLWHKSSHSNPDGGQCVDVAADRAAVVPVRDSKDPRGSVLAFSSGGWAAFLCAVKRGVLGV
jgi:hypothetical protein